MRDDLDLDTCVERFAREPFLLAVWIFGSAVSGHLRGDSDVDFALYCDPGKELGWSARGGLSVDLEIILGRKVDLGYLGPRNLIYAIEVFRTGRLVYAREKQEAMAFSSHLQSLYMDLKQDRKVVEEAYRAR